MKKLLMTLVLVLTTALSLSAKCDWSKVSLGKSNKCNVYTFEVTGTADTCYKHELLIIKKGATTPLYKGTQRVFSVTFNDTGYYYVKTIVKNTCLGCDTLFYNLIHVECKPATTKCDWSSLGLKQMSSRNYFRWDLSGKVLDDTCVSYKMFIYNFQTKKATEIHPGGDTFEGVDYYFYSSYDIVEFEFSKKGKYKFYIQLINNCLKCDTALYREVNLIYFPKCTFTYNLKNTTTNGCNDSMVGEMSMGPWIKGDTCWQWYSYIWNGPLLDSLDQHDWDSMSDNQLWNYYDFNDSDLLWQKGPGNDARLIKYKFPHDGHYLVATQWYNKCLNQDTFFLTRLTIETCTTSATKFPPKPSISGIKVSPNPCDDKVIFTIASTTKLSSNIYEVYDSKGNLVLTGKMGGSICVGTYNLPNGVYVVKIGTLMQKFIVKH